MTKPAPKRCVDCEREGITTRRKAPHPGPRCATHHRAKRKSRRNYSWERHIWETYGLTPEEYWAIYHAQGGKCYICDRPRAKSARKKLSVDHCHSTGRIRGLLCQKCNRDVLGHFRDDTAAFTRGITYLNQPPAFLVIGTRVVPNHKESA
ncbi:endonuclease VII domain-containing protein [Nocardia abscessus]|uniref:endonuclease VII domain-containing protein n=1 Tax=Nocardia abscessus TaxID=120957 RepID=UPI002455A477|nr:endonuclease VII domain-containing protein [Nocardia abscessus]